jgi:N-acetylglucosaminyl-diphospho-decaprenol L-rhamnosyltransferase
MSDLTCAVIHWNVPDLLAECLSTLLSEVERLEARGLGADVLVVDNASRSEVRERLRAETPSRVRILWSDDNLGYPRAANLAYDSALSPLVLIANPDLVFLPGSLTALVDALEDPRVALAGPAAWWDRDRTLMLNPGYPEDRERIEADAEARRTGRWPEHALGWQRRMVDTTFAQQARPIDIISGACILVRRQDVDRAGGLFDPALFLYYDDTDLCRRLHDVGLSIIYEPRAEIVHLFNQSRRSDVVEHMASSRRHFLAKHYGREAAERLLRLAAAGVPEEETFADRWGLEVLGSLQQPPHLAWDDRDTRGATLLAVGVNPQIVPAALAVRDRPTLALGQRFWEQLTPGPYWARATDGASQRVLGYWRFERP